MVKKIIKGGGRKALMVGILMLAMHSFISVSAQENRSIDGFGNNIEDPEKGSAGGLLINITTPSYGDGFSTPAGAERGNPRVISNYLFDQKDKISDSRALSDYNWVFGQFIDHDITLVETAPRSNPAEMLMIFPPEGDEYFLPNQPILMMRDHHVTGTGTEPGNPRRYENAITSFIDGSGIYGSNEERAIWLRTFVDGKLKTSKGGMLPWNTMDNEFNSNVDPTAPFMADETHYNVKLYVAGDVRANENPLLIGMHTIFVREHNRLCEELLLKNPDWDDEQIYQHARKLNIATLQNIVYNEWLPAQGIHIPEYSGYNPEVDPSIFNVFAAAAFRMGHTLINSEIIRMDNDGDDLTGKVVLKDAFFNPFIVNLSGGIDPFLKGMGTQMQQELDCKVIDDVRNFLFAGPGTHGLDLAAININRGRERGLPDYNTIRENFGLPRVKSFEEICSDPTMNDDLEHIYGTVDNIDPWVGMLAEDHMNDAIFGELVMTILERQFRNIRDGDRFYFERDPSISNQEKESIKATNLHDVIMRNTDIKIMQDEVFVAMSHDNIPDGPELEPKIINAALFPNPVTPESKLMIWSRDITGGTVEIYDNLGHLIWTKDIEMVEGENIVELEFNTEPKGAYNIKVSNDYDLFTVIRAIY